MDYYVTHDFHLKIITKELKFLEKKERRRFILFMVLKSRFHEYLIYIFSDFQN